MDRNAPPQIGKLEGGLAVPPICRADQVEKSFVLGNRQQLPLTKGPSSWSKIPTSHSAFAYIGLAHRKSSSLYPSLQYRWLRIIWIAKTTYHCCERDASVISRYRRVNKSSEKVIKKLY